MRLQKIDLYIHLEMRWLKFSKHLSVAKIRRRILPGSLNIVIQAAVNKPHKLVSVGMKRNRAGSWMRSRASKCMRLHLPVAYACNRPAAGQHLDRRVLTFNMRQNNLALGMISVAVHRWCLRNRTYAKYPPAPRWPPPIWQLASLPNIFSWLTEIASW